MTLDLPEKDPPPRPDVPVEPEVAWNWTITVKLTKPHADIDLSKEKLDQFRDLAREDLKLHNLVVGFTAAEIILRACVEAEEESDAKLDVWNTFLDSFKVTWPEYTHYTKRWAVDAVPKI